MTRLVAIRQDWIGRDETGCDSTSQDEIRDSMKASFLVFSDFHHGSEDGMLPPDFTDISGSPRIQNPRQKYLWDNFISILDGLEGRSIDYVVCNGDVLDGKQKKSETPSLTLHKLEDQKNAAIKTLKEIKTRFPIAKWIFVEGTPYHEMPEQVRMVAKHFTDEPVKMTYRLQVGNAGIEFHHEVGYSGGFLKSASLEKEIINGLLATAKNGWDEYHVHVRSHCHYFGAVQRGKYLTIVTPCLQLQNAYGTKNSPTKNIPDLGGIYLEVDDSLLERGMCPCGFEELLFPHPKPLANVHQ